MEPKDHIGGMEKELAIWGIGENGKMLLGADIRRFAEVMASPKGSIHLRNEFDNPMGARIYVDASLGIGVPLNHRVEFATPECATADDIALYDSATDAEALSRFYMVARDPERYGLPKASYHLLKASTDWKGHWWGCHKNFRIPRAVSDDMLVWHLALFLITKPIWAGQGGVGPVQGDELLLPDQEIGFLFSPRALGIHEVIGGETITQRRAIICTARFSEDDSNDFFKWKRLQLIESDPLLSDATVYVEAGLTALIIRLLANGGFPESFPSLRGMPKESIVNDFHRVVRDPTLEATVSVSDYRRYTALELQEKFFDVLRDKESVLCFSDEDRDVLDRFGEILRLLREDPLLLADRCECWWKYKAFQGLLERHQSTWKTCGETLVKIGNQRQIDLRAYFLMLHHQATALDDWGIWPNLQKKQKVMRLHSPEEIAHARTVAPSTRAAFRVALIKRAKELVVPLTMTAESWWKVSLFSHRGNYSAVIEKRDPTDRDNAEKLEEAEEIMQAFLKRRPRIVRA